MNKTYFMNQTYRCARPFQEKQLTNDNGIALICVLMITNPEQ